MLLNVEYFCQYQVKPTGQCRGTGLEVLPSLDTYSPFQGRPQVSILHSKTLTPTEFPQHGNVTTYLLKILIMKNIKHRVQYGSTYYD